MHAVRARRTGRVVRGDDEGFMTAATQMLEHPDHRVAHTVDLREERFGDDCNAHATRLAAPTVDQVAAGSTRREICSRYDAAWFSRLSSTASRVKAAAPTSQATTAMEPAGMIARPAFRCCTRTRLGSFLLYST